MQRVKARPARETSLLSEEDSFIEDVVEDSPQLEQQPLLTEVFRARDQDEMVTIATPRDRARDQEMVTIVNPSIRESKLEREGVGELGPGVNTSDHPVSLVYANNENQYAVDITTPTPEEEIEEDPIKEEEKKESLLEEEVEMVELQTIPEKPATERVEDAEKEESVTPESAEIAETSLNECNVETTLNETLSVERAEESEGTLSQHSESTEKPGLPEEIPVISATPEETVRVEKQDTPVQEMEEEEKEEKEEEKVEYEESEEVLHHDEKDDEEQPIYSDPEQPVENGGVQNIYHPEPTAQSNTYQPVPVESDESEEARSKTPEPQFDEYGNLLDENGHPVIKHAFPDDWVLQPDQEDGIMRFETGSGDQVRFIMNLTEGGFNYPNPPNQMRLEMDTYHKHIPVTHRIASGCEFFVDTGEWRLQLESDIVNLLLRMDVASDFEDVTGEVLWNQNKDITIENLTRAMTIFKDCILDDSPVRWMLTMDSVYNPKSATFRLVSETHVENVTKGVSIHDGMSFVDSKVTVSIPDQSDTEVRNVRNFIINKDSVLEEQGIRHLDSGGCHVEDSVNDFLFNKDVKLEDQGTRHLLNEDAKIEDQGTRHLLCEEGDMEDLVRDHVIHQDIGLDDIVRGYDMCEDSDRLDIKRHYLTLDQSINRTPAIWNNSHFEGELVDLKSNSNMVMDMKFEVSPSKFKLNQLDIDDDMLADIEDE